MDYGNNIDTLVADIVQVVRELSNDFPISLFDVNELADRKVCNLVVWINGEKLKEIEISENFGDKTEIKEFISTKLSGLLEQSKK